MVERDLVMAFQLHPRLQHDSIEVGRLQLSRLLMINDSQYPWFILVPERENISEIYQLSPNEQQQLWKESSLLAQVLAKLYHADKMQQFSFWNK